MLGVTHVEAKNVRALLNQFTQGLRFLGRRAERADNFSAAHSVSEFRVVRQKQEAFRGVRRIVAWFVNNRS